MEQTINYQEVINDFTNKRVLVLGDLMLDAYLKGTSTRLCPEAPVPVVDIYEKTFSAGGAGNAACNLRALGATVAFCSVIGDDLEGDEVVKTLDAIGVVTEGIIRQPG
ncbi:MAG TPA: PfkB family carbohydrate kinase, partial [Chryseosolibacter sp.]|nr:PfkB family carbohydrate kinase [Chryseosolibacter sp.]